MSEYAYTAKEGTEGIIQRIYVAYYLDNRAPVYHVDYKTGDTCILNLVNPNDMKFDCDRNAIIEGQAFLKKKLPKTTICSVM